MCVCACVPACMRACVRGFVRGFVRACVGARACVCSRVRAGVLCVPVFQFFMLAFKVSVARYSVSKKEVRQLYDNPGQCVGE